MPETPDLYQTLSCFGHDLTWNCGIIEQVQHPERGCKIVDQLIEEHIQHVETRITELQSFKTQLVALRQSCASDSTIDHCQIVKKLEASIE